MADMLANNGAERPLCCLESITMTNDPNAFRDRIRRYQLLLELNTDPTTRKVLADLRKEAETQLRKLERSEPPAAFLAAAAVRQ